MRPCILEARASPWNSLSPKALDRLGGTERERERERARETALFVRPKEGPSGGDSHLKRGRCRAPGGLCPHNKQTAALDSVSLAVTSAAASQSRARERGSFILNAGPFDNLREVMATSNSQDTK